MPEHVGIEFCVTGNICCEMNKVDESFPSADDSFLVLKIREEVNIQFWNGGKSIINNFQPFIIWEDSCRFERESWFARLIYLALAHIIKYRGHFLYEDSFDIKTIFKKSLTIHTILYDNTSEKVHLTKGNAQVEEILPIRLVNLLKRPWIIFLMKKIQRVYFLSF